MLREGADETVNQGARHVGTVRLLAADYDGTLAEGGQMKDTTVTALRRAKRHGLGLVLITGREFDDLLATCEHLELFDVVIAEDGAVFHLPSTNEVRLLAEPPAAELVEALHAAGLAFSRGRVILSTRVDAVEQARRIIDESPTPLHVSLNKAAAMYLPRGIDKGSGLAEGLRHVGIDRGSVVGFGDAENDLAFLRLCGVSVAVANALDGVKREVDVVTAEPAGDGVAAFIHALIAAHLFAAPTRRPAPGAPPDAD